MAFYEERPWLCLNRPNEIKGIIFMNLEFRGCATRKDLPFRFGRPWGVGALVFIVAFLATMIDCGIVLGMDNESRLTWGVNAVVLKSALSSASPSVDDLLADQDHTLALNR